MKNPIKTLEVNTAGRDFVIGDLHGAYELLQRFLKEVQFDKSVDRLISVGDLIDRGPDSLKCLELLYEPWFYCVLANHEQMMIQALGDGPGSHFWLHVWMRNGGSWAMKYIQDSNDVKNDQRAGGINNLELEKETEEFFDLVQKVQELPYLITIKRQDGSMFHVIHAELPPDCTIADEDLADPAIVTDLATRQTEDGDVFVWGRYKFFRFCKMDLSNLDKNIRIVKNSKQTLNPNLSHIISGHTIVQNPMTILGQTNIDTGAYKELDKDERRNWTGLTAIDLDSWVFISVKMEEVKIIDPVCINTEQLENLTED